MKKLMKLISIFVALSAMSVMLAGCPADDTEGTNSTDVGTDNGGDDAGGDDAGGDDDATDDDDATGDDADGGEEGD